MLYEVGTFAMVTYKIWPAYEAVDAVEASLSVSNTLASRIVCARSCGATLSAELIDGTDVIMIVAEREGWLGLTSGWYCPCCRSPECEH